MKIRHAQDFWSGLLFLAAGLLGVWLSRAYAMGTTARMGPGYFPTVLSGILLVLGLGITIGALRPGAKGGKIPPINVAIILWICGSVVAFALMLQYLGFFIACFGLIIIASMASDEHSWPVAVISASILAIASVAIFVWGLKLPFNVWPPFLTR